MSYANGTTHYNLPQTVGTDKRDWFDSNAAFAAVDAALYAAATGQASDAEAITALQQTVAGQATDIAALQTASSSHAASISALQTTVNGQATQIADVRQDAEDMITANNEGAAATSTRAYAVGDYFIYNDVLYRATDAIAIGDTIVPNTNCEATNVDTELTKLNTELTPIGTVVRKNGNESNVANDLYVGIAATDALENGVYLACGYVTFQSTNTTGSRMARFANNVYQGHDVEIAANGAGYTQVSLSEPITLDGTGDNKIVLQAKQKSGELMNISARLFVTRIK